MTYEAPLDREICLMGFYSISYRIKNDEWYRQLFERLDNSKFRSSFRLKQKDIDYINEKGLNANRHQCVDIQYLLPSTQQQHAAGSASESGIKCSRARN